MSFPPQKYGRYFVYDKIAVGGMAEIFKARLCGAENFQKKLVIKRLNCGKNSDYATKLFIDEAHLCAQLSHPNIVQSYDFSRVDDKYFIAMEYIEGQDLKQLLIQLAKKRIQIPISAALFIAMELCSALSYVHNKTSIQGELMGLIHRDISPANVLISYRGEIKLADFGIAKNMCRLYESNSGVLKGKYEYMSPEQARGEDIDHRSDIFCVGILLHEMLTGRRLFKSQSDTQAIERVRLCKIPEAAELNQRISPRLNQIIHTALAKNPNLRFQNAEMMRIALLDVLHPMSRTKAFEELGNFMTEIFRREIELEAQEEKTVRDRLKGLDQAFLSDISSDAILSQNRSHIISISSQNLYKNEQDDQSAFYSVFKDVIPWILTIVFAVLWLCNI